MERIIVTLCLQYVLFVLFVLATSNFETDQGFQAPFGDIQITKNGSSEQAFSFTNCNNTPVPMIFKNCTIIPDPVIMTGMHFHIAVAFDIEVSDVVGRNHSLEMDLSLRLKRDGADDLELCDILGPMVCYRSSICDDLDEYVSKLFPNYTCPFQKGSIKSPDILPLPHAIESPPFLIKGSFIMQASFKEFGRPVGCVEIRFCVNSCRPLDDIN